MERAAVKLTRKASQAPPVTARESLIDNTHQLPLQTEVDIGLRWEFGWMPAHLGREDDGSMVYRSLNGRRTVRFLRADGKRSDDDPIALCPKDDGGYHLAVLHSYSFDTGWLDDAMWFEVRFFVCSCGIEFAVSTRLRNWYAIALRCQKCQTSTRTNAQHERREPSAPMRSRTDAHTATHRCN